MISKSLAEKLNLIIAKSSGGSSGIRDEKLLLSAINRPFQTFDSVDLYPETSDKAAAIFQSIIINHPCIDSNKRMLCIHVHDTRRSWYGVRSERK